MTAIFSTANVRRIATLAAMATATACAAGNVDGDGDPGTPRPDAGGSYPSRDAGLPDASAGATAMDAAVPFPPLPDGGSAPDAATDAATVDEDASADAGPESDAAAPPEPAPSCAPVPPAASYRVNTVGGGSTPARESDHFRAFGVGDAAAGLRLLEAAHQCFVEDWCWRSAGLSITQNKTVYNKFNLYGVESLVNAAGVMGYDGAEGLAYIQVARPYIADPGVTVHEYGHALTLAAAESGGWVDQARTGAWWETVANWVADTFSTSPFCEPARTSSGIPAGDSMIDVDKIVGNSHMLIVSTQNYYEAWPFLTYLTNNPDRYPGLGRMVLPNMFKSHARNNETPLHVLERLSAPVSVQQILGRYWARMAYLDIGHPKAQARFMERKGALNTANVDLVQSGVWRVKRGRQPQYGGASIVPLRGTGNVSVRVTNLGNGLVDSGFTATLSIRTTNGAVRYVDLVDGAGEATIGSGEEASLVVVNTPSTLYQYDAFQAGAPETTGLNWQVAITGNVTP